MSSRSRENEVTDPDSIDAHRDVAQPNDGSDAGISTPEGDLDPGNRTDDASTPENVESRPATTDGVAVSGEGGAE